MTPVPSITATKSTSSTSQLLPEVPSSRCSLGGSDSVINPRTTNAHSARRQKPVQVPSDSHHHVDYRSQNGPCMSLLWSEQEYRGQSLYLGGVEGLDGNIYCIPGNAGRVLCIDPRTDRVYPLPLGTNTSTDAVSTASTPSTQSAESTESAERTVDSDKQSQTNVPTLKLEGKFKWLRGIRVEHIIYGLPCHSPTVLRIDTRTHHITLLEIPYETFYDKHVAFEQRTMEWKYHGGSYSPEERCIYCIPQSAWHVLRIDTTTDTCTLVPSEPLLGRCKWYGGVYGRDGAIYGIPHNASNVLRIHHNTVSLHGHFPDTHKWHGAAIAGNGTIVCVPANANHVLCIEPASNHPILYEIHAPHIIQTGRHRNDDKYKYLGSTRGSNGRIYCFPSGAEHVLEVDTVTRTVQNVGPNLVAMERLAQNKWQNGIRQGDFIYAIPLSAESVLRIDISGVSATDTSATFTPSHYDLNESTSPPSVTTWRLPQPNSGLAKWEGAVMASLTTGAIYCMPNNHKAVLRIADMPSCVALLATTKSENPMTEEPSVIEAESLKGNRDVKEASAETVAAMVENTKSEPMELYFKYTTGIPTLRSSAHRVKFSPKHRDASTGNGKCLPSAICENLILDYDLSQYDFTATLMTFLKQCDPSIVGAFSSSDRLEDFQIPLPSLSRGAYGGCCEEAQWYLSNQLASYEPFMHLFDNFVVECILPHLKQRLLRDDEQHTTQCSPDDTSSSPCSDAYSNTMTFYYQRPPTLRLQPGPARAYVKPHCDSEYGHQPGELNFWFPLTDRTLTKVDLHVECPNLEITNSTATDGCVAVPVQVGQVLSFHGTSRKHFVNSNATTSTRISMDFRVGVEGYFDAEWEMLGTTSDHTRRRVQV